MESHSSSIVIIHKVVSSVCVYVQVTKLSSHSYREGAKFEKSHGDD